MSPRIEADAVVLDIEGTTSATGFVVDVLYPYSRPASPRCSPSGPANRR